MTAAGFGYGMSLHNSCCCEKEGEQHGILWVWGSRLTLMFVLLVANTYTWISSCIFGCIHLYMNYRYAIAGVLHRHCLCMLTPKLCRIRGRGVTAPFVFGPAHQTLAGHACA